MSKDVNFKKRMADAERLFKEKQHIEMTQEESGAFSGGFRMGYDDCLALVKSVFEENKCGNTGIAVHLFAVLEMWRGAWGDEG